MQITPLVLHAAARLPALTDLFSEPLVVSSMTVVAGGLVTLTTAAPHGIPTGSRKGMCVLDAATPNPVAAAEVLDSGDVLITLSHDHDLTTAPPDSEYVWWNIAVELGGFANAALNGVLQLVDLPGSGSLVVRPAETVSAVTLTGAEKLLERLENGLIGWHKVTAVGPSTLTFSTPPDVARSFTVASPKVAREIRIAGALDIDTVGGQYVNGYAPGSRNTETAEKPWLFIVPPRVVQVSKDRNARTDMVAEITPASDYRQLIVDGFQVIVLIPAKLYGAGVGAADLCSGPLFRAVLRTFHGLKPIRPELPGEPPYVCMLTQHGVAAYDKATYMHAYTFESGAYLTSEIAIRPHEATKVAAVSVPVTAFPPLFPAAEIAAATFVPADTMPSVGTSSISEIMFGPEPLGIRHDEAKGVLTATVLLD